MKNKLFIIIGAILVMIMMFLLKSILFWLLGNFVILVFKINYNWTIFHGIVCELIYLLLKDIFVEKKEG